MCLPLNPDARTGRVIGMNTGICSSSGGFAGIGFAVPVDTSQAGGQVRPEPG
jgi:hypothetical protein|nr:hypothetical protein [Thiocapsa sp.]